MKDKKRIVGLLAAIIMVCLLAIPKVANAITSPVYLYDIEGDFEELYDENTQNEAGTAIYDETSGTLTLNNYHGSSIEIFLDTDLTIILKGENVITAGEDECGIITFLSGGITITGDGSLQINNGDEGLSIQSSKLQINSGNITITDATMTGISVFGDLIINGGNIIINHTGEDKIPIGIMSMNKVIINGGNIKVDADEMGIYTYFDYTKINGGKVVVNADHVGILAGGLLSIQGDYLEINTPNNNTSAALAVDSADISALDIASDLVISNKEVTKQAILLAPDYTVSLITLGKDGASASAEDGMSDLVTSNVANSIKIYKTHKLSFDKNGGSGQMADVTDLAGIYTLPKNEFTAPSGKRFKGWSLTSNGEIITELEMDEDKVVYAIWEDISEEYEYVFLKGNNQKLTLNDIKNYSFTIDGDYALFESLSIGDIKFVKNEDYKVTEGSTIITFTDKGIAKLNNLKDGEYDIKVKYSNGKEVTGKVSLNVANPETSDNIAGYLVVGIISLLGISYIVCYSNKKYVLN